ncbi:MAG: hypothetical protein ACI863_001576 [Flavobacteriales bacterium]|jgi:hypothetical protein
MFLISISGFSQCDDIENLKFGGYYGDSSFKNVEMAFKYFSIDIDTTQYCCDINKIKKHADFILDKSKKHIVNRANADFFKKLIFQDIMVIYHDFKKLENYYDVYLDLDKCGKITYWITYEYQFSESVKYGFGLEFDKQGNLVSNEKFPDFTENTLAEKIIEVCQAIETVKKHEKFKNKTIESVELNYLDETNSFVWLIKEDRKPQLAKKATELEKWYDYSVDSYYVNGNTNQIDKIQTQDGRIIYCGATGIFKKKDKE